MRRYTSATFGGVVLTNAGREDSVLWKMNADGTTLWVRAGFIINVIRFELP